MGWGGDRAGHPSSLLGRARSLTSSRLGFWGGLNRTAPLYETSGMASMGVKSSRHQNKKVTSYEISEETKHNRVNGGGSWFKNTTKIL